MQTTGEIYLAVIDKIHENVGPSSRSGIGTAGRMMLVSGSYKTTMLAILYQTPLLE